MILNNHFYPFFIIVVNKLIDKIILFIIYKELCPFINSSFIFIIKNGVSSFPFIAKKTF